MFHHYVPLLVSKLATVGRHAADFCHQVARAVELSLCRLKDSRRPFAAHEPRGVTNPSLRDLRRSRPRHLPLLIHYHIFKNAGSSFGWALEQAMGDGFRSFDTSSPKGFISTRDLVRFSARHPEVRAISSHQAAPPAPRIRGREVFTSILIRDPIARIWSVYAFERRQRANSLGAIKAKQLNFREYVEWRLETAPATLCNFQVHFCSRTAESGMFNPGLQQLKAAIANLDAISIVGTVSRYDEWLALAQKVLSELFPGVMLRSARLNATADSDSSPAAILGQLISDLGDATAQYLLENNELDICLHQIADALLTRRLAEHRVGLALLQAYSSARRDRQPSSEQLSGLDQ